MFGRTWVDDIKSRYNNVLLRQRKPYALHALTEGGNEQGVRPLRVKNDGTVLCLKMEKL